MCLKYMINTQTLAVSPRVENVTKTNLRSRVWNDQ